VLKPEANWQGATAFGALRCSGLIVPSLVVPLSKTPTGKTGSVLIFHGNLRKIVYLTLCAVSNHITMRPDWIAHRDFTPILSVTTGLTAADAMGAYWQKTGHGKLRLRESEMLRLRAFERV
jgi:hypothetical protein